MAMHQRILCAVEPNEEANEVVSTIAAVAPDAADIRILHVLEPLWTPYADLNFTPLVEAQAQVEHEMVGDISNKLEALAQANGLSNYTVDVRRGYAAHEIITAAQDYHADLIVIGTHNRRGVQRLLGSTAHAVFNNCQIPILAVHPSGQTRKVYDNLLLAIDASPDSVTVMRNAKTLIERATNYAVLSVVQPISKMLGGVNATVFNTSWPLNDMQSDLRKATSQEVTEHVAEADLDTRRLSIMDGDPAQIVCETAEAQNIDLIVMGAGQRSRLNRILLGSTTHAVLNHTPCDVYVDRLSDG